MKRIKQLINSIDCVSLIKIEWDRYIGINIELFEIETNRNIHYLLQLNIKKESIGLDLFFIPVLFILYHEKVFTIRLFTKYLTKE